MHLKMKEETKAPRCGCGCGDDEALTAAEQTTRVACNASEALMRTAKRDGLECVSLHTTPPGSQPFGPTGPIFPSRSDSRFKDAAFDDDGTAGMQPRHLDDVDDEEDDEDDLEAERLERIERRAQELRDQATPEPVRPVRTHLAKFPRARK